MTWGEVRWRLFTGAIALAIVASVVLAFIWFVSAADSSGSGRLPAAAECDEQPDPYATDAGTKAAYDAWLRCAYPNVPSWRPHDPAADLRQERWAEVKLACESVKGAACSDAEVDELLDAAR